MKKILVKKTLVRKILVKKIEFFLHRQKKLINKYYQKHKERLRKEARERYQHFSEEEKGKR